jgi:hypothetical protein
VDAIDRVQRALDARVDAALLSEVADHPLHLAERVAVDPSVEVVEGKLVDARGDGARGDGAALHHRAVGVGHLQDRRLGVAHQRQSDAAHRRRREGREVGAREATHRFGDGDAWVEPERDGVCDA